MMKVIFLDFDGVVNSQNGDIVRLKDSGLSGGFYQPELIDNVNRVLEAVPEAKIVVSSTWRLGKTVEELQEVCDAMGLKGEVVGKTISLGTYSVRGNEILAFIKDNKDLLGYEYSYYYKSYVIIDDDSDMLLPQAKNFIQVDNEYGFTVVDAHRAISILKGN